MRVERDENKTGSDRKHDEHPVLAVKAKKGKVLDQKMQRSHAPVFGAQDKHSGFKNILFLYLEPTAMAAASAVNSKFLRHKRRIRFQELQIEKRH